MTGKCPANPALQAGSRGTIKKIFPFREALAYGRGASFRFRYAGIIEKDGLCLNGMGLCFQDGRESGPCR